MKLTRNMSLFWWGWPWKLRRDCYTEYTGWQIGPWELRIWRAEGQEVME